MARTPDTIAFATWFSRSLESHKALFMDFKLGRLKHTGLMRAYRARNKETQFVSPHIVTKRKEHVSGPPDALTQPYSFNELSDALNEANEIKGIIRLDPAVVYDCCGVEELKGLLADALIGCSSFKDINNAINSTLIYGDSTGMWFEVICYEMPEGINLE